MPFLDVTLVESEYRNHHSLFGDEITVGRAKDCDISIAHRSLSRHHCRLVQKDGRWHVLDADSSNGTKVNRRRIHAPHVLQEGDLIACGVVRLSFHIHDTGLKHRSSYHALRVPRELHQDDAVEPNYVGDETAPLEYTPPPSGKSDEILIDTEDLTLDVDADEDLSVASEETETRRQDDTDSLWLD
ncbi:MAG: FHA domain-containing protein [Planctomycetota bacterium]